MGAREERLAGNEALFREVNERVAEVATLYIEAGSQRAVDFTCECGLIDCSETMMMTIAEYEAIRAHSLTLASSRSTAAGDRERDRAPSYFVVEKREEDAQELREKQIRGRSVFRRWSPRSGNGGSAQPAGQST